MRAVFLDRDGVLNHSRVRNGKPYAPQLLKDFIIYDEALPSLQMLKKAGFLLIVVTNQPDVGNGVTARTEVAYMHNILMQSLPLDKIFSCFHSQPAGCECRKPKPGMLVEAAYEYKLTLRDCFLIGDRGSDIEAGIAAGCQSIFIDRGYAEPIRKKPCKIVGSLSDASKYILADL